MARWRRRGEGGRCCKWRGRGAACLFEVEQPLRLLLLGELAQRDRVLLLLPLHLHDLALLPRLQRLVLFALDRLLVGAEELVLDADRLELRGELGVGLLARGALLLDLLVQLELRVRDALAPLRLDARRLRLLARLALGDLLRRHLAHRREALHLACVHGGGRVSRRGEIG